LPFDNAELIMNIFHTFECIRIAVAQQRSTVRANILGQDSSGQLYL
jgi:hypothetical protein